MVRFICALALTLGVLACDETGRIIFSEISHDFGNVPQMETAKHVFKFSNEGPGTLLIKDIHAD